MILLKMENRIENGKNISTPLELIIEDQRFKYKKSHPEQDEFFKKLEKYKNYKIKVEVYNAEGELLKSKNYIIKDIRRNIAGIMALELD